MKKNFLTKITFLALAFLCLGTGSAWGEDSYTSVYTKAVTGWTADDVTAWGGNANLAVDATYGLGFNPTQPNKAYSATKSFTITSNAKVKYEVTWYTGNSTGRTSNYEYIQFGDKVRISYNSNYKYYLDVTGASASATELEYYKGLRSNTISIIFNTATKTVESFIFNGTDITKKVSGTLDGNFNSVTFGFQRGGSTSNWEYPNYLTAITVSQAEQSVTIANYTINYKNGATTVKTVESTSTVGATITADRVVYDAESNKYLTDDETLPSMTLINGTNTLNVNVHAPKTATLKVTTTIGSEAPTTATTDLIEADDLSCTWSYTFPLYKKGTDEKYYKTSATTFGESGTFTNGQTIEKSVTYPTAENDVVYFTDAPTSDFTETKYTYSNGESGVVVAQNARDRGISVGTLTAGCYRFEVYMTGSNGRSLVIRDGANDPFVSIFQSKTFQNGLLKKEFILSVDATAAYINGANSGTAKTNQSEFFDYAIIRKLESITYTKDLSTTGFASFSAPVNVTVPAGTEAYKAAVSGSTVTLTKVGGVIPANNGVILYNSAKSASVTLTGTTNAATADFGSNELIPTSVETNRTVKGAAEASTNTYYALNKNTATFGKITADLILSDNKAYLKVSGPISTAMDLNIDFADGPTGIEKINVDADNDVIYNVYGIRVDENYKGLVIVNGKKYLNK